MISFAHSFWTGPLLKNKFYDLNSALEINLIEYALSVEYVHRNGYKIVLYTDVIGAELFSPIPYDEIVILENTITDNYHFAASFKFVALEHMPLEQVLIDGDIFLYKSQVYGIIETDSGDVIVSMFEPKQYIEADKERCSKTFTLIKPFKFAKPYETPEWENFNGWYNTSLMKFNNEELKEKYIEQYKYHINIINNTDFQNTWPDVVLEQLHLTYLCQNDKYSIHTLLEDFPSGKYIRDAMIVGFAHLGCEKQSMQQENIQALQEFNPNLYENLTKHIKQMTDKYLLK
jgi:hypothetical protein